MSTWLVLVGAYLLGSLSPSYLLVRLLQGRDIRAVGSGNPGTTNVLRAAGKGVGSFVFLVDVAKGALAVMLARQLGLPLETAGYAGLAAVLGHVYPPFMGLNGGKGVATAAGVVAVIAPLPALALVGLFVAIAYLSRFVALASTGSAVAAAPVIALMGRLGWTEPAAPGTIALATVMAILIVGRHRSNLRRLVEGTEEPIGHPTGERLDPR